MAGSRDHDGYARVECAVVAGRDYVTTQRGAIIRGKGLTPKTVQHGWIFTLRATSAQAIDLEMKSESPSFPKALANVDTRVTRVIRLL